MHKEKSEFPIKSVGKLRLKHKRYDLISKTSYTSAEYSILHFNRKWQMQALSFPNILWIWIPEASLNLYRFLDTCFDSATFCWRRQGPLIKATQLSWNFHCRKTLLLRGYLWSLKIFPPRKYGANLYNQRQSPHPKWMDSLREWCVTIVGRFTDSMLDLTSSTFCVLLWAETRLLWQQNPTYHHSDVECKFDIIHN